MMSNYWKLAVVISPSWVQHQLQNGTIQNYDAEVVKQMLDICFTITPRPHKCSNATRHMMMIMKAFAANI